MALLALVAVPRPIFKTFHYSVPLRLVAAAAPGVRCLVPFAGGRVVGYLLELAEEASAQPPCKDLEEVLDPAPVFSGDLLRLGRWLAAYYHHPPGDVFGALLPPSRRLGAVPSYSAAGDASHLAAESPAARLWLAAQRRGSLPYTAVSTSQHADLDLLVSSGLLVRQWVVPAASPSPKRVWYELSAAKVVPASTAERSPRLMDVLRALSDGPVSREDLLEAGVSPPALRRAVARGWVCRRDVDAEASLCVAAGLPEGRSVEALTVDQETALDVLRPALGRAAYQTFLLHGVTGSGKTEIYIRAVQEARRQGRGAIVLVPEISLTPQFLGRFFKHFGDELAVLHSGLGERERCLQWEKVRSGRAPIAIGARSAVFAPVPSLGIVVVDEEHEPSYKQDEGFRYNAKHVALQRARLSEAVALLGSATPDVESYWGALTGRYCKLELPVRARAASVPEIRVVDLRQEERRRKTRVLLSEPLRFHVDGALERGEQVLLFLNRRGFSPAVVCAGCGESVDCPKCSVAMTLHGGPGRGDRRLICHYCSIERRVPEVCSSCGMAMLQPVGAGTQRLFDVVRSTWPSARTLRLDRDAARRGGGTEVLRAFHQGEADILVGTQMVAKGHDFPRLTVVGVIDADLSLNFPDFRAAERTYQILTQVAGRAGRADLPGVVILQTRNPGHPVLDAVVRGDFEAFARAELESRREAGFPPFRRLALLSVSSVREEAARSAARTVAEETRLIGRALHVEVLGPSPAPIERVRGRYRFQVLLRAPGPAPGPVQEVLRRFLAGRPGGSGRDIRLSVDVDPISLL